MPDASGRLSRRLCRGPPAETLPRISLGDGPPVSSSDPHDDAARAAVMIGTVARGRVAFSHALAGPASAAEKPGIREAAGAGGGGRGADLGCRLRVSEARR